jgi:small ligand-binding sensory domain FIST
MTGMRWASAVSDLTALEDAVAECVGAVEDDLKGARPDLGIVFVSRHHLANYAAIPALLEEQLGAKHILGCSAGGVIGAGHEVEHSPGFSLTAAILPGVELSTFHLDNAEIPDLDSSPRNWTELIGITPDTEPHFIVLPDPFSFDAESFLTGLDFAFPKAAKIGGLASGASAPGENVLFCDDTLHREGAVGLALSGEISVDTVVAQGCRPIGSPLTITRFRHNLLMELDGRQPTVVLQELYGALSPRDRELFNHSLFLGIVMNEFQEDYQPGDFLIRNIIGWDRGTGTLAIGAVLKEQMKVQFHLRDAVSSADDLQGVLSRYVEEHGAPKARGGLLFSCLGRGSYLYGRSDHDTSLFRDFLGDIPLGGFFCNGEIGPVHGSTHLHGYTSSFGLFRPR